MNLTLEKREDGVAVISIDVEGESQNTITESFGDEMKAIQKEIDAWADARAVVITSKKPGSFIAGADIEMLRSMKTRDEAQERSREGQKAFDEMESNTGRPTVAAIDGACLGGGLELALACHGRVASSDRKTKLGLPEVQLGLLPGLGGTQRLVELVGLEVGLDLLLTGKQIDAKRALKMGLVDDVVPPAIVLDVAIELAKKLADEGGHRSIGDRVSELTDPKILKELALAKNPAGRMIVFDQAEKKLREKAGEHYPAPYRILEVVRVGLEKGRQAGLELESERFGELVVTDVSKRLIEIFFATTELKKDNGTDNPKAKARDVKKIGVLGAGIMGHGITYVTAQNARIDTRMRDMDPAAVGRGLGAIRKIIDERVERRRMTDLERSKLLARISGTTDYSGFSGCDMVIEAVFEDLEIKHKVLKEVEANTSKDTIFASNTSSIPITKIAKASSRPENVVGMHYFSPVHKMPLLEVIRTKQTSDDVVATAVALGKKQQKTVIVVNDGVGFYTSRILAPYMNEASWILADGIPIEDIDKALVAFGFPVGPITLLDEVGIDTGEKVGHIMHDAFGDRLSPPPGLDKLITDGRTGRKGKKGFYTYGGKKKTVDQSVYRVLGIEPKARGTLPKDTIADRLVVQMVAEALRCLGEGILRSPRDGDIGAIFGLGFPPFLGGPFRYADKLGAPELLRRMRGYADRYGKRFAPPEILDEHAKHNRRFYE